MALALLLLLPGVLSEEVTRSASLLPRNYNPHPYDTQFLKYIEPTKQGPVLFPNDGPPRPRTPLIVTARPLLESISRSELNNSIAEPSQVNRVFTPGFLARIKDYRPFVYPVPTITPFSNYDEPPYADVLKKARVHAIGKDDRYYNDYEEQTLLPPIYKALSDHAQQKVLKIQQQQKNHQNYDYQAKEPNYSLQQRSEDDNEDNQNKNYAFSYTVKDHKTGDDFSHKQHSSGSATNGEYRVRLPDGRMQIVSYTADENGYKADVRYDDEDSNSGNRIDNNVFNNVKHDNGNGNNFNDVKYEIYNKNNVNEKHDYVNNQPDFKVDYDTKDKTNDYYNQYDTSKEYYNDDLSTEYESKSYDYEPHRSKFTGYQNTNSGIKLKPKYAASFVKPSYEKLKDLLVNKEVYSTVQPNYFTRNPVEIRVPSTTPLPINEDTTEHVVLIGGNKPIRYTSIVNSVPVTPSSIFPSNNYIVSSTPRSYLASTIAGLIGKIPVTPKPILSQKFIDKINKYLSFTK